MFRSSNYPTSGLFRALHTFLGRRPVRRTGFRVAERRECFQPRLEALEDRTLLSVQIMGHYNGIQYYASGGWLPPDTVGAAGPTSYMETTNAAVAIYTPKDTGTAVVSDDIYPVLWVTGGLPHASQNSILGDATILFDDQVQRFIVADMELDTAGHTRYRRFQDQVAEGVRPGSGLERFGAFDGHGPAPAALAPPAPRLTSWGARPT